MLRSKCVVIAGLLVALVTLPAQAEKKELIGGEFVFAHAPVDPTEPAGYCTDPDGLLFSVTSQQFCGSLVTEKATLPFSGSGDATGCAFAEPQDGVAAVFTGSLRFQLPEGELLATFQLLDYPIENVPGVFQALVFLDFQGGTGKYRKAAGTAIAVGYDFPFGGLNGGAGAGVIADIIEADLKLKD